MNIRVAGPEDIATVAELLCRFRDHMRRDTPPDDRIAELVLELIARDDVDYLLAGSDAVAQVRYRYGIWLDGLDACLEDLFVREQARGQGLGRALVEAVLARARERGCGRIELDVDERNQRARRVYEALGFRSEGHPDGLQLFMRARL